MCRARPLSRFRDKYGLSSVIKLASNENPLGTSPVVQKVLVRNVARAFRYPENHSPRLTAAIAESVGVSEECILVGNGSDEIIDMLFRMKAIPGKVQCCLLREFLRHVPHVRQALWA